MASSNIQKRDNSGAGGVHQEEAEEAKLRQGQVAKRIGRYQSFVAAIESGQKRIGAVELVEIAEAIGFDPAEAIRAMVKVKK